MSEPLIFLPAIQAAITPVILMTGTGGLMLSLTNRMGRVVDRTRALAAQMTTAHAEERRHLEHQLDVLWRRARLVRGAVTAAAASMLGSCLLVIAIFAATVSGRALEPLLLGLFCASLGLLILSLIAFLRDIYLSLHALRIEVDRARRAPAVAKPMAGSS